MQKIKISKKNGFYRLKTSQNVHAKIVLMTNVLAEIIKTAIANQSQNVVVVTTKLILI